MQDPSTDINFVNFNQDCSSLAIGTRTGYKLLSLSSVDKLELIYESACRCMLQGGCCLETLPLLSLLPLLSQFSMSQGCHHCWKTLLLLPSCLSLPVLSTTAESLPLQERFSCQLGATWLLIPSLVGTEICQYSYSNTILAVKLNRARLVVCLEEALYIHNIRDMKVQTWIWNSDLIVDLGAPHNPRHSTQPKRSLRPQHQQWQLLPCISWLHNHWGGCQWYN